MYEIANKEKTSLVIQVHRNITYLKVKAYQHYRRMMFHFVKNITKN